MVLAATLIDFLDLITFHLRQLCPKQFTYHADQQEKNCACDQFSGGNLTSRIGHTVGNGQKNNDRCNICHKSENTEHHIADHITCLAYHTEIAQKQNNRQREKDD